MMVTVIVIMPVMIMIVVMRMRLGHRAYVSPLDVGINRRAPEQRLGPARRG